MGIKFQSQKVESIPSQDMAEVFHLLYQLFSPGDRAQLIGTAKRFCLEGELNGADLIRAYQDEDLLGVLINSGFECPVGQLWGPQVKSCPDKAYIEDRLIQIAIQGLREQEIRLVQELLSSEDLPIGESLTRNGIPPISYLLTLQLEREGLFGNHEPPQKLTFVSYSESTQNLFHQTMIQSYAGTLDFPELDSLRAGDELIESHKEQGVFRPDCWFLGMVNQKPVGLVLLAELPEWQEWELSYVGIVPDFRRRGYGRILIRKAIQEAQRMKASQLVVSVDSRNTPALKLYSKFGFETYQKKLVHFASIDVAQIDH